MSKIRFLGFIITLISLSSSFAMTASSDSEIKIPIRPNTDTSKGDRPKAPSMQSVDCSYEDGWIDITFRVPEGYCTLIVTDLNHYTSQTYSFDSATTAHIYIGELTNALISISTANGHQYEGEID